MHPTPLSVRERVGVQALVGAATAADGVPPLNEAALLALDDSGANVSHRLAMIGEIVAGYAQADPALGSGQLVVLPGARRRGIGSDLLEALARAGCTNVWAFGNLPAARGFAAARGLTPQRGLSIMSRDLIAADAAAVRTPPGLTLRAFDPGRDAEAFLEVNARAFATHSEQGRFSLADLRARMAQPWWDPAGFVLAFDSAGLAGFHWTKRHDATTGEVYVIGVDPRAQGTGIARVLLAEGLRHLAATGCRQAILYVDTANRRAVEMYAKAGFRTVSTDVQYAIEPNPAVGGARP